MAPSSIICPNRQKSVETRSIFFPLSYSVAKPEIVFFKLFIHLIMDRFFLVFVFPVHSGLSLRLEEISSAQLVDQRKNKSKHIDSILQILNEISSPLPHYQVRQQPPPKVGIFLFHAKIIT